MLEPDPVPDGSVDGITTSPSAPGTPKGTGEDRQSRRRVQRTINFDSSVLERARAAATYLAEAEPGVGIRSLVDIVNPAVDAYVAELERKYNDGKPFPTVLRMPSGRPSRRG
ncbi:hypothetical protein FKR81_25065 [Lentzea tibetensis]|uniref:Uncharacterized protein n=1 Tax=Lentzea tibetensis TaxID=2591470 RepID=A0A563EPS6_9PSEU|nr:hypothetical protein FKR81_25065 [Lentzea tibetensis]